MSEWKNITKKKRKTDGTEQIGVKNQCIATIFEKLKSTKL